MGGLLIQPNVSQWARRPAASAGSVVWPRREAAGSLLATAQQEADSVVKRLGRSVHDFRGVPGGAMGGSRFCICLAFLLCVAAAFDGPLGMQSIAAIDETLAMDDMMAHAVEILTSVRDFRPPASSGPIGGDYPYDSEPVVKLDNYNSTRTIYVAAVGGSTDSSVCGSIEVPCASLLTALGLSSTVILLPGEHLLDTQLVLFLRHNVTITGDVSEGVRPQLRQADGYGGAFLYVINCPSFTLASVELSNWQVLTTIDSFFAVVTATHSDNLTLRDCVFEGNSLKFPLGGQETFAQGCCFMFTSEASSNFLLTVTDSVFRDNFVTDAPVPVRGVGLKTFGGRVTVTNTLFTNNTINVRALLPSEASGAGMYLESQAVLTNCTVTDSFCSCDRSDETTCFSMGCGAYVNSFLTHSENAYHLEVLDCTFSRNRVGKVDGSSRIFSAGLYFYGETLYMTGSVVEDNSVEGRSSNAGQVFCGGGMSAYTVTGLIENTTFASNSIQNLSGTSEGARGIGGGLLFACPSLPTNSLTVRNCIFSGNKITPSVNLPRVLGTTALGGAAVIFCDRVVVSDCVVEDNIAAGGGSLRGFSGLSLGAGLLVPLSEGSVERTNFTRNLVYTGLGETGAYGVAGGGLALCQGDMTVDECTFDGNIAIGGNAAAGALVGRPPGMATGGGLFIYSSVVDVVSTSVVSNQVLGGSYSYQTGFDLPANDAGGGWGIGGGIGGQGQVSVRNSSFAANKAASGGGPSSVAIGGAACLLGETQLAFLNCTFFGNIAGGVNVQGKGAGIGGALALSQSLDTEGNIQILLDNLLFADNVIRGVDALGGAVALLSGYSHVSNSAFIGNQLTATKVAIGGGLMARSGARITNSFFSNCTSRSLEYASQGGAVGVSDFSLIDLEDVVIENCAADYGGGICSLVANLTSDAFFLSSTFVNNTGMVGGGGVFLTGVTSDYDVVSCQLDGVGNSAEFGSMCASEARALSFIVAPPLAVWPGEKFPVLLTLSDLFANDNNQQLFSVIANPDGSPYFRTGVPQDTAIPNENGAYLFKAAQLIGTVGTSVTVSFATKGRSEALDSVSEFRQEASVDLFTCPPAMSFLSDACFPCELSTYNFGDDVCVSCPIAGVPCVQYVEASSRSFYILDGYYPSSFDNPASLTACPIAGSCIEYLCTLAPGSDSQWDVTCGECDNGGSGLDCHCADGYTGRLCSQCVFTEDVCYFKSGGKCESTDSLPFGLWMPTFEFLVYLGLSVTFFSFRQDAASGTAKTLVFFAQCGAVFMGPMLWDYGLINLLAAVSSGMIVNFLKLASLRCLSYGLFSSQATTMAVLALLPTFVVLPCVIFLLWTKAAFRHWKAKKANREPTFLMQPLVSGSHPSAGSGSESSESSDVQIRPSSWKEKLLEDSIHSILFIVYASFFGVCNLAFSSWACTQEPSTGVFYSQSMPWLECSFSSEWILLVGISVVLLIVYVLCPLALFAFLLFTRDLDKQQNIRKFGFLYESYRREVYWWELVAMVRKLFLSFSLSVLNHGHSLYHVLPVTVLALYTALQLQFHPYHEKRENIADVLASAVLIIGFQASQYTSGSLAGMDVSQWASQVLVLALAGGLLTYLILTLLWRIKMEHGHKLRRYYGMLAHLGGFDRPIVFSEPLVELSEQSNSRLSL